MISWMVLEFTVHLYKNVLCSDYKRHSLKNSGLLFQRVWDRKKDCFLWWVDSKVGSCRPRGQISLHLPPAYFKRRQRLPSSSDQKKSGQRNRWLNHAHKVKSLCTMPGVITSHVLNCWVLCKVKGKLRNYQGKRKKIREADNKMGVGLTEKIRKTLVYKVRKTCILLK